MTTYTSQGPAAHLTLAANTTDTVTLNRPYAAVEIVNDDTTTGIWVTIARGDNDQTFPAPTVGADASYWVGPGAVRVLDDDPGSSRPTAVKVRADTTTATIRYHVTGQ